MNRPGFVNFVIASSVLLFGCGFLVMGACVRVIEEAFIDGYRWMDEFFR